MFFTNRNRKVIERNELWYVETPAGYEGPFDTRHEANKYLSLCNRADVARVEFAGCEDSI